MSARLTARLQATSSPASRRLVGTVAAFALLLQTLFAMPVALRMSADTVQWLQFGSSICSATTDGVALASDHRPSHQLPSHKHAQCLICQGQAFPLGLLAVVL